MNKELFLKEFIEKTNVNDEDASKVCDILERHFIIGKKNKDKITTDLINELQIDVEKADEYYEISMSILASGLKDALKHPFRSKD